MANQQSTNQGKDFYVPYPSATVDSVRNRIMAATGCDAITAQVRASQLLNCCDRVDD